MEKNREYLFDNIKAVLILLVVVVHLSAYVRKDMKMVSESIDFVMAVFCAFHMPLFMFISGYFSKNLQENDKKVLKLMILYFLAQAIVIPVKILTYGKRITFFDLFLPQFSLWYLLAIMILRLLLPVLVRVRHILTVSFLISIFVMGSHVSGEGSKAIVKTAALGVFFLLGYYCTEENIKKIRTLPRKILGGGVYSLPQLL